jgi:Ca2+-binding EF-hand superfamily protein
VFIHILVLKRVFDSFDQDNTGRINSSELERVLQSLNVNLSKQAYEQILKEGDRDCMNIL